METAKEIRTRSRTAIRSVVVSLQAYCICEFLPFSADLPEAPEDSKYCSSRINYRTKEPAVCCDERNDECTFDMGDGVRSRTPKQLFKLFISAQMLL